MARPAPVASTTLLYRDLVRLASARILSEHPEIGAIEQWVIDIVSVPGGLRFDLVRPATDGKKP